MEERLQKILAAAGLCSRRAAETLLTAGRVTVNGHVAQLGEKADAAVDEIWVDGAPLPAGQALCYLMLNKPRGYVTTLSDEKGRPTVAELVGDAGARVYPVGRLDMDSEGLLLLTNDGAWAQRLLHPSYEITKSYLVTVTGEPESLGDAAERLAALTDLEGEPIRQATVRLLWKRGRTAEFSLLIHEGKNRQIRRMCTACGLSVERLQRVAEHSLRLGTLPLGKWRKLTGAEVAAMEK
ncbi:MAG: pseudouridine synthase [Oscillospiraceae bacterium]